MWISAGVVQSDEANHGSAGTEAVRPFYERRRCRCPCPTSTSRHRVASARAATRTTKLRTLPRHGLPHQRDCGRALLSLRSNATARLDRNHRQFGETELSAPSAERRDTALNALEALLSQRTLATDPYAGLGVATPIPVLPELMPRIPLVAIQKYKRD